MGAAPAIAFVGSAVALKARGVAFETRPGFGRDSGGDLLSISAEG